MPLKLNGEVVKFEDAESFIQFMTNCDVSGSQFRKGQLAFNVLREHKPLLAEKIRGVLGLDPFYNDQNLERFYRVVNELWNNE